MLPHLVAQGKDQTNAPKDYDETLDLQARDSWKEKLQEHSNGHLSISAPPVLQRVCPLHSLLLQCVLPRIIQRLLSASPSDMEELIRANWRLAYTH